MRFMNLDKSSVKQAATGRWAEIFSVLAPQLRLAQAKPGKHCPCPVHGGTDGFRLFPDYQNRGNGICNTCGPQSDGFQMLMWLNEWTFPEAIQKVGNYLGLKPVANQATSIQAEPAKVDVPTPTAFVGQITFIGKKTLHRKNGAPATVFTIKVKDSSGCVSTCMGIDLERAASAVKAKKGHQVRITRLGVREVTLSNGQKVNKTIWDVEKLEKVEHSESKPPVADKATLTDKRSLAIERLWNAGRPLLSSEDIDGTPLERYLLSRGLDPTMMPDVMADSIRYIPSAFYRNEETGETESYPAMLTAVRDINCRLITVHRTFLTEEGQKAPIATPKRLMALPEGSTITGAAIQFGRPDDVLCIAEGVETALSVMLGTGYPCWAAISAIGMTDVLVPQNVKTVLIFADKDRTETGAKAAETLRARLALEGKLAVIVQIADDIPEGSKGLDWNDILRAKGSDAFPVKKASI